jgi:hypothetical protein
LVTKPLHELDGKRAVEGSGAKPSQYLIGAFRRPIAETQKAISHLVRARARLAGADDLLGQPPQVFDKGHTKVDGDGPEFTDAERLGALVGAHEGLQRVQVKSTVGMRDVGPCQPIDARVPSEVVALGDLWQDLIKASWEVIPNFPDLFVYDVKVVEEPLFGLRDLTFLSNHLDDVPVPSEKHLPILADTGE